VAIRTAKNIQGNLLISPIAIAAVCADNWSVNLTPTEEKTCFSASLHMGSDSIRTPSISKIYGLHHSYPFMAVARGKLMPMPSVRFSHLPN